MVNFGQIGDAISALQRIRKEIDEVEFQERILDLRQMIADAREENLALRERVRGLQEEMAEASDLKAKLQEKVEVEGYLYDNEGGARGLPYCPLCLEREQKLFRMVKCNDRFSECYNCGKTYPVGADGRVHAIAPQPSRPNRRVV